MIEQEKDSGVAKRTVSNNITCDMIQPMVQSIDRWKLGGSGRFTMLQDNFPRAAPCRAEDKRCWAMSTTCRRCNHLRFNCKAPFCVHLSKVRHEYNLFRLTFCSVCILCELSDHPKRGWKTRRTAHGKPAVLKGQLEKPHDKHLVSTSSVWNTHEVETPISTKNIRHQNLGLLKNIIKLQAWPKSG